MYMESIFIAEVRIQQQKINETRMLRNYSHFRWVCWLWWKTIL